MYAHSARSQVMAETTPHWIDYPNKRAVIGPNRPRLAGIRQGRLRALVLGEIKYMHRS